MATRVYHLFINSFLVVTRRSYKVAYILGTFTDNALNAAKADADILAIYNKFHPVFLAFQTTFNNWKNVASTGIAGTFSLQQLLAQLMDNVHGWEITVAAFYKSKKDAGYVAIFPNGFKPFYTGTQKDEIDAVKHLSDALNGIAGLAAVKTDVDGFYGKLIAAYNAHQGQDTNTGNSSDAVEAQRILLCNGLLAAYGGLLIKYAATPLQIGNFIDAETMQNKLQYVFVNNHVKTGLHNLFQRTILPTDQIKFYNNGTVPLIFYWAMQATDMPTGATVVINPTEVQTHNASDFGDVNVLHFFNVQNNDANEGSYEVDLV